MNILSKLPFLDSKPGDDIDAEAFEIQSKADRIAYHRAKVRNGPVSLKTMSTGQFKRAQQRELKGRTKKARRSQVRGYLANQREAATLRAHLQEVGILSFATPHRKITFERAETSLHWLLVSDIKRTKQPLVDEADLGAALTRSLNRYQALIGEPTTPLSPAYTIPVVTA